MSEEKQDTEQVIDLSDDDLKVVLRLLSDEEERLGVAERSALWALLLFEERLGVAERSALRVLLLFAVAIAIMVFACPAGLLIVWFERVLGVGLLIASVVAMIAVIAIVATQRNPFEAINTLRQSVEDSPLGRAIAARIKPSQVGIGLGCGGGLAILAFFLGIGWFLYDLVAARTVNLFSLLLIAIPVAFAFLLTYYQMRRDALHYSRVSQLRGLLESQSPGSEKKAISSKEVAFLRQLETKQMMREVRQAAPEERMQGAKGYPIIIGGEARDRLDRLPLEQTLALRRVIDSLQFDPRPLKAKPVEIEDADLPMFRIREGNSAIVYSIDEKTRRVAIVAIQDAFDEEVEDAS